ncbi:hypothetical protein IEN92_00995 [Polynucleobacter sp. MWH-Creno-3A4]|uniref:hypothetical protein n=1 Tax=Polynucleobacter sp. MWH-Creno-3A4 TaxID=1855886 RepID=UPI001C0CAB33|nr:hypothetical protein [Polynucleobacter sp. MWH-Creno-3A4]MBU3605326.1 hypothetical protein [Polynucleobacter sp. MWH-Creno-3A4]
MKFKTLLALVASVPALVFAQQNMPINSVGSTGAPPAQIQQSQTGMEYQVIGESLPAATGSSDNAPNFGGIEGKKATKRIGDEEAIFTSKQLASNVSSKKSTSKVGVSKDYTVKICVDGRCTTVTCSGDDPTRDHCN